jgi:hypothetical protein
MSNHPASKKRGRSPKTSGRVMVAAAQTSDATTNEDSDAPAPVVPEKKGMCLVCYVNTLLMD